MRQVIGKKMYDTEKAELVAFQSNMADTHNFNYEAETLYRTKAGAWFLHGKGHARSKYGSRYADGSQGWGERIVPLNAPEASDWLERHEETSALEQYFGDELTEA